MISKIGPKRTARQITQINKALTRFETPLFRKAGTEHDPEGPYCYTRASNMGAYQRTNLKAFNWLLENTPDIYLPPNGRFVDLGSGLGGPAFVASLYFRKVTAVEEDKMLHKKAMKIRRELGPHYRNVELVNRNMLTIDVSPYDVLFMYRAFCKDFPEKARNLFAGAKQGAIVIFNGLWDTEEISRIFEGNYSLTTRGNNNNFRFWTFPRV